MRYEHDDIAEERYDFIESTCALFEALNVDTMPLLLMDALSEAITLVEDGYHPDEVYQ